MDINEIKGLAKQLRKEIIEISHSTGSKGVHIGPALSIADILAVLYGGILNVDPKNPADENRDRFILSKGHAYAALFSILSLKGYFSHEFLVNNFMTDGGEFPSHPIKDISKGIECSSGSLGMGLSFAIGKALNAKKKGLCYRTYCLMGDGECDEGSVWEGLMSGVQYKLDNLTILIDHNKLQQDAPTSDEMDIPFVKVLSSLGWKVYEVDGHDVEQLYNTLSEKPQEGVPTAIVCNTTKGKGVSFMENNNAWHHAALNDEQYEKALKEIEDE